jgi:hypothetical protein
MPPSCAATEALIMMAKAKAAARNLKRPADRRWKE